MKIPTIALLLMLPAVGALQAQQPLPIRQLGAVTAKTSEPRTIAAVRATSGGVLVNDPVARRVLLFDPTLASFTVVADSTSATANAYSGRSAGLIAYRGDSTLFVDPASMSMLVLDGAGKVARVVSVPRSEDVMGFAGGPFGGARYDPAGRLVYRAPPSFRMRMAADAQRGAMPVPPEQPDSAPLVRVDLSTRRLDTVAFIKVPKVNMRVSHSEDGGVTMTSEINPLPVVDDWALLPDGSVAIARGSDYRVDFIAADGTRRASSRLPFEWQRLSDEDKVTFIDSVKTAFERARANAPAGSIVGMPSGSGAPVIGQQIVIREGPGDGAGRGPAPAMRQPQMNFVDPDKLPDYRPPFFAGAMSADPDGNLWIRTTKTVAGGLVYDVINSEGRMIDRVQLPAGRSVVGFGPGVVYLSSRDGTSAVLERANLR